MPRLYHPALDRTVVRSERQARVLELRGWTRTDPPDPDPEFDDDPPDAGGFPFGTDDTED